MTLRWLTPANSFSPRCLFVRRADDLVASLNAARLRRARAGSVVRKKLDLLAVDLNPGIIDSV